MGKTINIRPSTGVYATYKNIKYDPWSAIAEFVDNSTQSYYDHEHELTSLPGWEALNVDIYYDKNKEYGDTLVIEDNAYGMNFSDFQRAIILDSPPKVASRSEFGMGLKTAACWFGVIWRVESTELGSDIKYAATIDVDMLHVSKDEEIEVEEIPCDPKEHGTVITITNLNRQIVGKQIKKTKDQLRGMYRNDLKNEKIVITYNNERLMFTSPAPLIEELPDGTEKVWRKRLNFSVPYKDKELSVTGFVGVLETANTSGAGFALLRRGRVIVGGYENTYRPEEIFGKANTFIYQRLYGELNLDDWPVTQTKDDFDWYNGSLEDDFIKALKSECEDYRKKANTYRKKKIAKQTDVIGNCLETYQTAGIIDNVTIEPIAPDTTTVPVVVKKQESDSPDNQSIIDRTEGIIVEGQQTESVTFTTETGHTFTFKLNIRTKNPAMNWLRVTKEDSTGPEESYLIDWNIRHPFFKPFIDEPDFLNIMQKFVFAMALAEVEATALSPDEKISPYEIRLKMNDFLKKLAKE